LAASHRTDSGVYNQTSTPITAAPKPTTATPRQPNGPSSAAEIKGARKPPAEAKTT
jgi:hypothetical protein